MKVIFLLEPNFIGEQKVLATRFYTSMPLLCYRQRVKIERHWYLINSTEIDVDQNAVIVELIDADL